MKKTTLTALPILPVQSNKHYILHPAIPFRSFDLLAPNNFYHELYHNHAQCTLN